MKFEPLWDRGPYFVDSTRKHFIHLPAHMDTNHHISVNFIPMTSYIIANVTTSCLDVPHICFGQGTL